MRDISDSDSFQVPNRPPKRSLSAAQLAALQKSREARARAKKARIEAMKKCAQARDAIIAAEKAREKLLAASTDSIVFDTLGASQFSEDEVKEVHQIVDNFIKTTPGYVIHQIDRIVNPFLEQNYEATRKQFQNNGLPVDEELQYHGTTNQNIKKYSLFPFEAYS